MWRTIEGEIIGTETDYLCVCLISMHLRRRTYGIYRMYLTVDIKPSEPLRSFSRASGGHMTLPRSPVYMLYFYISTLAQVSARHLAYLQRGTILPPPPTPLLPSHPKPNPIIVSESEISSLRALKEYAIKIKIIKHLLEASLYLVVFL